MYLVAIAWIYVVLMMSVAEATAHNGSVLGALITFSMYGLIPLSIVMYVLRAPARNAARKARDAAELAVPADAAVADPAPDAAPNAPSPPITSAANGLATPRTDAANPAPR